MNNYKFRVEYNLACIINGKVPWEDDDCVIRGDATGRSRPKTLKMRNEFWSDFLGEQE